MSRFVGDVHNYVNAQGDVVRDAPCHCCSQNLRGTRKDGKCPGCGAPVAFSVCGDYLCFFSPQWLRGMAYGIYLVLWGMLASVALRLLAAMLLDRAPLVGPFLACAGAIVTCWGAWLMTRPDPSGIGDREYGRSRRLLRAVMATTVAATVAHLLAVASLSTSAAGQITTSALLVLCALLSILGEFAKLHFVQHLAMRIPDQALAWRAGGLKWAAAATNGLFVLSAGLASVSLLTMDFKHPPRIGNFGGAMGVALTTSFLILPLTVVLIAITAMTLDVLHRTARAIRAQIPLAVDAWSSSQAGIPGNRIETDPTATTPTGTASALLDAPEIHQPMSMSPLAESWGKQPEPAPAAVLKVAHLANAPPTPDPPGD